jgi:hypothetical protein
MFSSPQPKTGCVGVMRKETMGKKSKRNPVESPSSPKRPNGNDDERGGEHGGVTGHTREEIRD